MPGSTDASDTDTGYKVDQNYEITTGSESELVQKIKVPLHLYVFPIFV